MPVVSSSDQLLQKTVERTSEIGLDFFFLFLLHWFLVATDRIARLSQKVDQVFSVFGCDFFFFLFFYFTGFSCRLIGSHD